MLSLLWCVCSCAFVYACFCIHMFYMHLCLCVCSQPLQTHMETRCLYQVVFLNCFSIIVFWVPVYLDITISTRSIGHWTPEIQLPMLPTLELQAHATMLGFHMGAEVLNQILTFRQQAFCPLVHLFNSIFNHFLFTSSSSFIWFYPNIFRTYCRVFMRK